MGLNLLSDENKNKLDFKCQFVEGTITTVGTDENFGYVEVQVISGTGQYIFKKVSIDKFIGGTTSSYLAPKVGEKVRLAIQSGTCHIDSFLHSDKNLPKENTESPVVFNCEFDDSNKISLAGKSDKFKFEISLCGFKITFDQENSLISIADSASDSKNSISIDKANGLISLKADKSIELDVGGKKLTFAGDSIDLGTNDLNLTANNLNLTATQKVVAKGVNVELNGSAEIKVEGLNVSVNGSAKTAIAGGMVSVG